MEKEFLGIGRGYVLAYLCVILTAIMLMVVPNNEPKTYTFLLGYWKDFMLFFVVPIVGAKELGKIGIGFSNKKKQ